MIADDRGSEIAGDLKESSFHIIKRSQSPMKPFISLSGNVKCTATLCSRENRRKQHGGHRGGNFAARKFNSSFSPKATTSSASKPKETSVLCLKNFHEKTQKVSSSTASDNDHKQECSVEPIFKKAVPQTS